MNEDENSLPQGLEGLSRLDETRIRLLWHFDWWDGPLHGLAEYNEAKAWFAYHDMDEPGRHYFYKLYLLTDAQITEAELWHTTHGAYDHALEQWVGRDESRHNAAWTGPDLSAQQPVGWFTDGRNNSFYGIQVS